MRISPSVLRREGIRACLAFALYLALHPIWIGSGGRDAYERLVLSLSAEVVRSTRHFHVHEPTEAQRIPHFHLLIVLGFSYFVVSHRMPWKPRIHRLIAFLAVIVTANLVAIVLQAKIGAARAIWKEHRLLLLLPREFQVAVWTKYMLFEFGLQLGPFLVMALEATWNSGARLGPLLRRREPHAGVAREPDPELLSLTRCGRTVAAGLGGAALLLLTGASVWLAYRESDPRHVRTHATLGEHFFSVSQWQEAEEEYRAAIKGGCRDGRVWYHLASMLKDQGKVSEALLLLRCGLEAVEDPRWRDKMRGTASRWGSGE